MAVRKQCPLCPPRDPACPYPLVHLRIEDTMKQTVYKGREVRIELVSRTDLTEKTTEHLRAYVNGVGQFSFNKYTDEVHALREVKRYIDAVDAAAEKQRHRYAADGYVKPTSDFADSWQRNLEYTDEAMAAA
jgi:hypothetical protein